MVYGLGNRKGGLLSVGFGFGFDNIKGPFGFIVTQGPKL